MTKKYSLLLLTFSLICLNGCMNNEKTEPSAQKDESVETVQTTTPSKKAVKPLPITKSGVIDIIGQNKLDEHVQQGPTIVKFSASWCGPCKMIAPYYKQLANQTSGINFLAVDGDRNGMIVSKYSITGYPTFIAFKDGKEFRRFTGANEQSLGALVRALK